MGLKNLLKSKLTMKEMVLVPSSFDVVGNIAIFNEMPKQLAKKEKIIASALLKLNPAIKTVTKKVSPYSGKLRLPKLKVIEGEKTKETIHKENNIRLLLDVEKCYFSPRLSNERLRILKKVKKGEEVLVLFAGTGPYTCAIAKNTRAKLVYAIELNKTAHEYALENLKLNRLSNVVLIRGDVKKVLPKIEKKFDRIIMPLPKDAERYLGLAVKKLKPKGEIHLYSFAREADFKKLKDKYKKKFKKVDIVKCGVYSPYVYRVCLDLKL